MARDNSNSRTIIINYRLIVSVVVRSIIIQVTVPRRKEKKKKKEKGTSGIVVAQERGWKERRDGDAWKIDAEISNGSRLRGERQERYRLKGEEKRFVGRWRTLASFDPRLTQQD